MSEQLKPYLIPLLAVLVLGGWFAFFRPTLKGDGDSAGDGSRDDPEVVVREIVPTVKVMPPKISGDVKAKTAVAVAVRDLEAMKGCYAGALRRSKGKSAGQVSLELHVKPDGSVERIVTILDGAGDPALVPCLTKTAEAWRFPSPGADGAVILQTLSLSPKVTGELEP